MTLLDLPFWKMLSDSNGGPVRHITIELEQHPSICPRCGVGRLHRFGTEEQLFKDMPIRAVQVLLHIQRQRFRCRECGFTFWEELPDMNPRCSTTERLRAFIERESLKRTFISVSEETGVPEGTVRRIFGQTVELLNETYTVATPEWLGIDEIHLAGRPRCVLSNVKHRTIIEMLKDRNRPIVARFLSALPDRNNIQIVAMDMWRPYKEAAMVILPEATIVVDKFHILRMATAGMDAVRKEQRDGLEPKQRRKLMHDRFILLRRGRDLTPKDQLILHVWLDRFPVLRKAYETKEAFFGIWDLQDRTEAEEAYAELRRKLGPELERPFKDLTTAMDNWSEEVFAYFDYPVTNAYTESLNGLVRLTNRIGRGYSFGVLRAKILYEIGIRATQEMVHPDPSKPYHDLSTHSYGVLISTLAHHLPTGLM